MIRATCIQGLTYDSSAWNLLVVSPGSFVHSEVFYLVPCVDHGTVDPEMENNVCLVRSSGQILGWELGFQAPPVSLTQGQPREFTTG